MARVPTVAAAVQQHQSAEHQAYGSQTANTKHYCVTF
jgi:hypothetical protein